MSQQLVNTNDPKDNPFDCTKSGVGRRGDACDFVVGAPSCSDGLGCYPLVDGMRGRCLPYCEAHSDDPSRGCDPGETCTFVVYGVNGARPTASLGYSVTICIPPCPTGFAMDTSDAFYPTCRPTGSDAGAD
jgi:hypothetical protein